MRRKAKRKAALERDVILKIEYVRLPEERIPAWCEGLKLLLTVLKGDQNTEQETERSEVTKTDE